MHHVKFQGPTLPPQQTLLNVNKLHMTLVILNIKIAISLYIYFKYLFNYGLLNYLLKSEDHVTSSDHIINKQRIGKDMKASSHIIM
jgi:hypothetical protein